MAILKAKLIRFNGTYFLFGGDFMNDGELCFCGSGRPHAECHGHINKNSIAARLYRIQNEIGNGPESEICGEWCSRCLCVSETEFVQILDYLINNWPKEKILEIIKKSKKQMDRLKKERPETAKKIKDAIPLNELFNLDKTALPFSCVFCDCENRRCEIENVRPLKCRVERFEPAFGNEICSFIFLRKGDWVIIRRPEPLFFYFCLIFKDEGELDKIRETVFFRDILGLYEEEYLNKLLSYGI